MLPYEGRAGMSFQIAFIDVLKDRCIETVGEIDLLRSGAIAISGGFA